jgi:hypothetical protein
MSEDPTKDVMSFRVMHRPSQSQHLNFGKTVNSNLFDTCNKLHLNLDKTVTGTKIQNNSMPAGKVHNLSSHFLFFMIFSFLSYSTL